MTFTSHGHHIVGTHPDDPAPATRARCGGPAICKICAKEAYQEAIKLNTHNPISLLAGSNITVTKPAKDATMSITTQKYARKRFEVDAVQITDDNMSAIADWCLGEIAEERGNKFIRVKVLRVINDRQTKGFVGDWVLLAGGGFKVYTTKAFLQSFDPTGDEPVELMTTTEKLATVSSVPGSV
jgi:hypothetical protein